MTSKTIEFRAVHTITKWRKASHETIFNAKRSPNRGAHALFLGKNNAIDLSKHGEPLFVVIWNTDTSADQAFIIKNEACPENGFKEVSIPVETAMRMEASGTTKEELQSFFA